MLNKTIAGARLNQAFSIISVSALNTYDVIPVDLDLFFLDLSASGAIPHCFAVAVACELYGF